VKSKARPRSSSSIGNVVERQEERTRTRKARSLSDPTGGRLRVRRLLDVLLCPPDNFRWLPTSAISRATLASGAVFTTPSRAASTPRWCRPTRTRACAATSCEPDTGASPIRCFARDFGIKSPAGPIVTQPAQPWRRGEYAPVIRFYEEAGDPDPGDGHRRSFEGGDFMIVVARRRGDRQRRGAHAGGGGAAGRRAGLEADGWEVAQSSASRRTSSTSTCLACMLGERLAACAWTQVASGFVELAGGEGAWRWSPCRWRTRCGWA
jgi:hypothetical protein